MNSTIFFLIRNLPLFPIVHDVCLPLSYPSIFHNPARAKKMKNETFKKGGNRNIHRR